MTKGKKKEQKSDNFKLSKEKKLDASFSVSRLEATQASCTSNRDTDSWLEDIHELMLHGLTSEIYMLLY